MFQSYFDQTIAETLGWLNDDSLKVCHCRHTGHARLSKKLLSPLSAMERISSSDIKDILSFY